MSSEKQLLKIAVSNHMRQKQFSKKNYRYVLGSFDKPDKAIYNSKELVYRKNNFSLEFSNNKVGNRRPRVAWGNQ